MDKRLGKRKRSGNLEEDEASPKVARKEAPEDDNHVVTGLEGDPEKDQKGKLKNFRISKQTRSVLKSRGVTRLFPIQYLTFDPVYEGNDVIGHARTGTGKTLSFVLPLLEKLCASELDKRRGRPPQVLVMAPTRELANQVTEVFTALAQGLSVYCIYGGVSYEPQESAMRSGLDVLVGTPGRILDHMQKGNLDLAHLQCVVLDEADQMLERGFAETVDEILAASFNPDRTSKPQMLLFSATVPYWVTKTALRYMNKDRVRVDLVGQEDNKTAVTVEHKALCCPYSERPATIAAVIQLYSGAHGRTMIFTNTKQEANELALNSVLKQECQVLHGDILQKQREMTLKGFREGRFPVLVATDVAARGLDVPEVDLVVQCEPPKDVGAYIHRSGRTGRAGRTGTSVVFYKLQQEYLIKLVEKRAGIKFLRIGAPQPSDLVKAAGRDAVRSLEGIPASIPPLFHVAAEELIKERGAVDAVAASLAFISGLTEVTSRSLLSSHQGFTTMLLECDQVVYSPGYFWKILEQRCGANVREKVKGLRMTIDAKAVVFDLPKDIATSMQENWRDSHSIKLSCPLSLPALKPRPQDFYDQQYTTHYSSYGRGSKFSRGGCYRGRGGSTGYQMRGGYRTRGAGYRTRGSSSY